MRTVRDAKLMAKTLRTALRGRSTPLSHGESLDIVARQFGYRDWNTLSALLKRAEGSPGIAVPKAVPRAWDFLATYPAEFAHGIERGARNVALIRHAVPQALSRYGDPAEIFGCYMQSVSAVPFHGRRIAVAAELATEAVSHGATIWARVDRQPGTTLAFDNLKGSEAGWLFGDRDWVPRRLVIPVAPEAVSLAFGFFVKGTGALRVRDVALTPVEADEPLTAGPREAGMPTRAPAWIVPENLDFAETCAARAPG